MRRSIAHNGFSGLFVVHDLLGERLDAAARIVSEPCLADMSLVDPCRAMTACQAV
jgi:hypothetical protein